MVNIKRLLLGKPLQRSAAADATLPSIQALPILASDALSSVAYATEAMLVVLLLAGSSALHLSMLITLAVIALIAIIILSYRQVISAYPNGGGSYVVCRENLGANLGLVAGSALLIDYSLTAAVSLMAGGQALSVLFPWFLSHEIGLSLIMLTLIGWVNLRGVKEAGQIFALPTYSFVAMVAVLLITGAGQRLLSAGFTPDPPAMVAPIAPLGLFLILRAFSSGCSALTGIEAISNGVKLFQEPAARNARRTLVALGVILALLFWGVGTMAWMFGVVPNSRVTVLAQIGEHVLGDGSPALWCLQISTLLILALAANTAFTGFPKLAAMLAEDHCLPVQMRWVGDRLVYQNGIVVLMLLTAVIILICQGNTDIAVNLYALGVFTAFTLSQLGLMKLWHQRRSPGWRGRLIMNGIGAVCTFTVLIIIVISKFAAGAWSILIVLPLLYWMLTVIRKRYRLIFQQLTPQPAASKLFKPLTANPERCVSLVYVPELNRAAFEALRYASTISDSVKAVVVVEESSEAEAIQEQWLQLAGEETGAITLEILHSTYSSYIEPFKQYVSRQQALQPHLTTTVVMPIAVTRDWLDHLLLNQRMVHLYKALSKDNNRIFSVVRYYIREQPAG